MPPVLVPLFVSMQVRPALAHAVAEELRHRVRESQPKPSRKFSAV
jgi:hypothetical protein